MDELSQAKLQHFIRVKAATARFVRKHGNPLIDAGCKVSDLYLRRYPDRLELGLNGQPPIATLAIRDCFDA